MPLKIICLWAILLATACTENLREAPAVAIRDQVVTQSVGNSAETLFRAPELLVRHFRLKFYGYDTVYYYLQAAESNNNPAETVYRLQLDANYGGDPRHYDAVSIAHADSFATSHLHHETIRCQIFGSMTDSCLYRDRADIVLSLQQLEAARQNGLNMTLSSTAKQYETLDLPANYIDGFLQAVQNQNPPL